MNFIVFVNNGKNCSESIVQGISFHNKLSIGNLMSKNRCEGECFLERVESILTEGVKLPRCCRLKTLELVMRLNLIPD